MPSLKSISYLIPWRSIMRFSLPVNRVVKKYKILAPKILKRVTGNTWLSMKKEGANIRANFFLQRTVQPSRCHTIVLSWFRAFVRSEHDESGPESSCTSPHVSTDG